MMQEAVFVCRARRKPIFRSANNFLETSAFFITCNDFLGELFSMALLNPTPLKKKSNSCKTSLVETHFNDKLKVV